MVQKRRHLSIVFVAVVALLLGGLVSTIASPYNLISAKPQTQTELATPGSQLSNRF